MKQNQISISYQGVSGSFSHHACLAFFRLASVQLPDTGNFIGVDRFHKIFDNVVMGQTRYGMVPIENSTAGSIIENHDLLRKSGLYVIGEIHLNVKHQLAGTKGASLAKLKKIYTHPKAFEQCEKFLANHPEIERINFSDTAGAAKFVSEKADSSAAAICSLTAAELYQLQILAADIHDTEINTTRFFIISKDCPSAQNGDKCSLVFELPHIPGSLLNIFQILLNHSANITKIESRPNYEKKFEYFFFLDFELDGQHKAELIDELKENALNLRVLGWYKSYQS